MLNPKIHSFVNGLGYKAIQTTTQIHNPSLSAAKVTLCQIKLKRVFRTFSHNSP
jgi:hypothetical protein